VIESLKQAENGDGWIVRLYEPHGGRGRVRVTTPIPDLRVAACNHVEEDNSPICSDGAGFDFDIKPFEVRTFRLRGA